MANETAATNEKRVKLFIPKGTGANEEPNLLISVNGVNYVLPKGKESLVPPCVEYEYRRANAAQIRLDEKIDKMTEESK